MKIISPYQAIENLKSFISAVERLEVNDYPFSSSKTRDINKVNHWFHKLGLLASVAQFNKNEVRAWDYIHQARKHRDLAFKWLKGNN